MFVDILVFETFFKKRMIRLDNFKNWFKVNLLGIPFTEAHEFFETTSPGTKKGTVDRDIDRQGDNCLCLNPGNQQHHIILTDR